MPNNKKRYVARGSRVIDTKVGGAIIDARNHAHASAICKGLNAYEHGVYALMVIASHGEASDVCKCIAKDALAHIKSVIQ